MGCADFGYRDRSAEWRHWERHFLAKGCTPRKALELAHRKMRRG